MTELRQRPRVLTADPRLFPVFCCPLVSRIKSSFSPEQVGNGASRGGGRSFRLLESRGHREISGLLPFPTVSGVPPPNPACLGLGFLKADPETRSWVLVVYLRGCLKALNGGGGEVRQGERKAKTGSVLRRYCSGHLCALPPGETAESVPLPCPRADQERRSVHSLTPGSFWFQALWAIWHPS